MEAFGVLREVRAVIDFNQMSPRHFIQSVILPGAKGIDHQGLEELLAYMQVTVPHGTQTLQDVFDELDVDRDGVISAEDWSNSIERVDADDIVKTARSVEAKQNAEAADGGANDNGAVRPQPEAATSDSASSEDDKGQSSHSAPLLPSNDPVDRPLDDLDAAADTIVGVEADSAVLGHDVNASSPEDTGTEQEPEEQVLERNRPANIEENAVSSPAQDGNSDSSLLAKLQAVLEYNNMTPSEGFLAFDVNGNGQLDKHEFYDLIKDLQLDMTEAASSRLFELIAKGGPTFNQQQFIDALVGVDATSVLMQYGLSSPEYTSEASGKTDTSSSVAPRLNDELLQALKQVLDYNGLDAEQGFQAFNLDQDGRCTRQQFDQVIGELNLYFSPSELASLFRFMVKQGEDYIDVASFVRAFTPGNASATSSFFPVSPRVADEADTELQKSLTPDVHDVLELRKELKETKAICTRQEAAIKQSASTIASQEEALQTMKLELQSAIEGKTELEKQISEIRSQNEATLSAAINAHNEALQTLKLKHEQNLVSVNEQHEKSMQTANSEHERELTALKEEHDQAVAALKTFQGQATASDGGELANAKLDVSATADEAPKIESEDETVTQLQQDISGLNEKLLAANMKEAEDARRIEELMEQINSLRMKEVESQSLETHSGDQEGDLDKLQEDVPPTPPFGNSGVDGDVEDETDTSVVDEKHAELLSTITALTEKLKSVEVELEESKAKTLRAEEELQDSKEKQQQSLEEENAAQETTENSPEILQLRDHLADMTEKASEFEQRAIRAEANLNSLQELRQQEDLAESTKDNENSVGVTMPTLSTELNSLSSKLQEAEELLDQKDKLISTLQNRAQDLETSESSNQELLNKLRQEGEDLQQQVQQTSSALEDVKAAKEDVEANLLAETARVKIELENVQTEKAKVKELEQLLASKESQLLTAQSNVDEARHQAQLAETRAEGGTASLDDLRAQLSQAREQLNVKQNEINRANSKIDSLSFEIKSLSEHQDSAMSTAIIEVQAKLDGQTRRVAELEAQLSILDRLKLDVDESHKQLSEWKSKHTLVQLDAQEKSRCVDNLRNDLAAVTARYDKEKGENAELRKKLNDSGAVFAAEGRAQEAESQRDEATARLKVAEIRARESGGEVAELRESNGQLRSEVATLKLQLEHTANTAAEMAHGSGGDTTMRLARQNAQLKQRVVAMSKEVLDLTKTLESVTAAASVRTEEAEGLRALLAQAGKDMGSMAASRSAGGLQATRKIYQSPVQPPDAQFGSAQASPDAFRRKAAVRMLPGSGYSFNAAKGNQTRSVRPVSASLASSRKRGDGSAVEHHHHHYHPFLPQPQAQQESSQTRMARSGQTREIKNSSRPQSARGRMQESPINGYTKSSNHAEQSRNHSSNFDLDVWVGNTMKRRDQEPLDSRSESSGASREGAEFDSHSSSSVQSDASPTAYNEQDSALKSKKAMIRTRPHSAKTRATKSPNHVDTTMPHRHLNGAVLGHSPHKSGAQGAVEVPLASLALAIANRRFDPTRDTVTLEFEYCSHMSSCGASLRIDPKKYLHAFGKASQMARTMFRDFSVKVVGNRVKSMPEGAPRPGSFECNVVWNTRQGVRKSPLFSKLSTRKWPRTRRHFKRLLSAFGGDATSADPAPPVEEEDW